MRIVQLKHEGNSRVALVENSTQLRLIKGGSTYDVAMQAIEQGQKFADYILQNTTNTLIDYNQAIDLGLLEVPCMHPDPAHCLVSGTGLTHLGSADTRSKMHADVQNKEAELTDSMKMFKDGLDGGKPADGQIGAEPEWFYKGDGAIVVPPYQPLPVVDFAEDAGEEPEIAGIFVIDDAGNPVTLGFCIGNEFSDHIKERKNYLLLAHSKLRPCSIGPELLVTETLPSHLQGVSRIIRDGKVLWEKPFLTGEDNMSHTFANLMHHHFKYPQFRRAGDMHIHFFGTATLSFADQISTQDGDTFEIEMEQFGKKLSNQIARLSK